MSESHYQHSYLFPLRLKRRWHLLSEALVALLTLHQQQPLRRSQLLPPRRLQQPPQRRQLPPRQRKLQALLPRKQQGQPHSQDSRLLLLQDHSLHHLQGPILLCQLDLTLLHQQDLTLPFPQDSLALHTHLLQLAQDILSLLQVDLDIYHLLLVVLVSCHLHLPVVQVSYLHLLLAQASCLLLPQVAQDSCPLLLQVVQTRCLPLLQALLCLLCSLFLPEECGSDQAALAEHESGIRI